MYLSLFFQLHCGFSVFLLIKGWLNPSGEVRIGVRIRRTGAHYKHYNKIIAVLCKHYIMKHPDHYTCTNVPPTAITK